MICDPVWFPHTVMEVIIFGFSIFVVAGRAAGRFGRPYASLLPAEPCECEDSKNSNGRGLGVENDPPINAKVNTPKLNK